MSIPEKVKNPDIDKVIGIMSGKGGVGKSTVTALAAVALANRGFKVGIMDADVTGPSIPKMFGVKDRLLADDEKIVPAVAEKTGVKIVSLNLMLENEDNPVIWRGPLLSSIVMQFWSDTNWGKLDYLLIDMPPGTGDIPLSIMQSVPLDGMLIVTTPQKVAKLIVAKSVNMAKSLDIPLIGTVQNMSYVKCPDCGKKIRIFGEGDYKTDPWTSKLIEMPMDPVITNLADNGSIESVDDSSLSSIASLFE